jgi:NADH-quinone oxidoreductase subunit G
MNMIEIEIDGKTLEAKEGSMIIQVADDAGIYIPRFCYHKKLSIAANCRMCLVEVEKAPKTLPACATPVTPGMKVFTQSDKALTSQKAVMEFLLINHPLDCPICDQGGECELQDLALGYGKGVSRYTEGKRVVKDKNLGPLVASDMTRCIQCTRCVRFGDEVAGMRELGATGRGDRTEIGTYIEHALQSELSGNVIDICPVGALTSKPFRYTARSWEMQQQEGIAVHDCMGSNIYLHTRGEEYSKTRYVMRVVPRENEAVNETWISDRDRYSYQALNSAERVTSPLLKQNGVWQTVDWETALKACVEKLMQVKEAAGAEQIAALASPNSTTEELFLLQKLMRGLGSHNVDHRLRATDFRHQQQAPLYPSLGLAIAELDSLKTVLLIGSNVRHEQPIANQRLHKAARAGANIMCINPVAYDFNYSLSEQLIVAADALVTTLAKVAKAIFVQQQQPIPSHLNWLLSTVDVGTVETAIASKLMQGEKTAILLGAHAINHPDAAVIATLVQEIAKVTQIKVGSFSEGANSAGAWLAGAVPHRQAANIEIATPGLDAYAMFKEQLKAYILLNVEPELDCAYPSLAKQALDKAEMVIVLSAFRGGELENYADVILPVTPFTETAGSYVNVEGHWQHVAEVIPPTGEARPAWKVLRVLGNFLHLAGFDYVSHTQIIHELKNALAAMPAHEANFQCPTTLNVQPTATLTRLMEWPMYKVDNVVRRAQALQATINADVISVRINATLADRLQLQAGDNVIARQQNSTVRLPVVIDNSIADNYVYIPAGLQETAGFGKAFSAIELQKNNL